MLRLVNCSLCCFSQSPHCFASRRSWLSYADIQRIERCGAAVGEKWWCLLTGPCGEGKGTCTREHWVQDTAKGCWLHVQSEMMLRSGPAGVLLDPQVCSRKLDNLKWNEVAEREAKGARLLTKYSWRCDMRAWPGVLWCTNEEALISNGKGRKGRGFFVVNGFAPHWPSGKKTKQKKDDTEAMKQIQYWRFEMKIPLPGTLLTAWLERGQKVSDYTQKVWKTGLTSRRRKNKTDTRA